MPSNRQALDTVSTSAGKAVQPDASDWEDL
jgi:hypothetical protein